ncbi:PAS domain S-box protein [Alicyclobacillus fastidiosus]|uniref:histidine kinase n=1 Tax=Alicyclobacillus fastidiosus TaxID=392011 RepID=A0ABV5AE57_9BACL|nr:PAS domain S-box protein [Alicyclobacillus fastidiosus]WEH09855.1 PAS domain S-box protein [Alicyclobacillus fastidiosus]
MFDQYFAQFGMILFPILVYQVWAFRKMSDELPVRAVVLGCYGGVVSIGAQLTPIHALAMPGDFQNVPIILAILYGRRKAGVIAVAMLVAFEVASRQPHTLAMIIMVLICASVPFAVCRMMDSPHKPTRFRVIVATGVFTTLLELAAIVIYAGLIEATQQSTGSFHLWRNLSSAAAIQVLTLIFAALIMEMAVEEGQLRKRLVESTVALEESEERYRSLVEYNPIGICAFDRSGNFVMVNQSYADMTGYSVEELVGQNRITMWFEDDQDVARGVADQTFAGQIKVAEETALRHKSGREVYVRYTTVPIVVGGDVVGFYGMAEDLTEARIVEEMIRKSEKLAVVGQLAAGVAHEIRNPLTSLKGFLKLIEEDMEANPNYFSIIHHELGRIDLIASELLVLAKPQAEHFALRNLNRLIEDVAVFLQPQALISNVEMVTDLHSSLRPVLCEENQLKQVFVNLIKNALDSMPSGGTVTIATSMARDQVRIIIQDTGIGMSEETIRHLGEPFYTTKGSGTGLGLMVTHRIIDRHGGRIFYNSALGKGTTVTLSFQCVDDVDEIDIKAPAVAHAARLDVR